MNWKDTVLKTKELNFKIKLKKNGSLDFVRSADLLLQAKQSFCAGVAETLLFIGMATADGKPIDDALLKEQMIKWGIADLWEQVRKKGRGRK